MTTGETKPDKEEQNFQDKEKKIFDGVNVRTSGHDEPEDRICFNCKLPLASSSYIVNIADHSRRWHAECFKCSICNILMDKKESCHIYKNKVICCDDYSRLKRDSAIRCTRCKWPISAYDWVRKASSYVYHIACFNCDICLRQLNTGEQFIIDNQRQSAKITGQEQEEQQTDENNQVRLLCRLHFSLDSSDLATRASDTKCRNKQPLDDQTKQQRRAQTHQSKSEDDLRPNLDQPRKFTCISERPVQQSTKSSAISMQSSRLLPDMMPKSAEIGHHQAGPSSLCETSHCDQERNLASNARQTNSSSQMTNNLATFSSPSSSPLSSASTSSSSSSSSSASSSSSTSSSISMTQTSYINPMTPTDGLNANGQSLSNSQYKSKRVRTTFTEDQLSILQTHFQIDSNPDGQDLERIATITGLSKRVTQVWFQNSRARQKKYLIKRKPMSGSASLAMVTSFNLAAAAAAVAVENSGAAIQQQQQHQQHQHFRIDSSFIEDGMFNSTSLPGLKQSRPECTSFAEATRNWRVSSRRQITPKSDGEVCKTNENQQDSRSSNGEEDEECNQSLNVSDGD